MSRSTSTLVDDSILKAYETLGDPTASPKKIEAAKATLEPQTALGHLHERTRTPLPSVSVVIQAQSIASIELHPQRPMRGPYWFGVTHAKHLAVRQMLFGYDMAANCNGEMPGEFFDVEHPELLIPIAGKTLNLGQLFSVVLHNHSLTTVDVRTTLWGTHYDVEPLDDDHYRPLTPPLTLRRPFACRDIRPLAGVSAHLLALEKCPVCHIGNCGFATAERYRRQTAALLTRLHDAQPTTIADRERENTLQARRLADLDATLLHTKTHAPFEPGDAWETPSDES